MNDPFQLVTNCTFKGKDYLVQMCVFNSKKLELTFTDKLMAEVWQCEYDASYIEALTHKTGNFKQFDVFVSMIKSGLLKTSDCISLDFLTLEDLEQLRSKKVISSQSSSRTTQSLHMNKRYLIVTYSVEFDRIYYPLPLEYCGLPDPTILQNNIRKLENEVERLKQKNHLLSRNDVEDTKKLKQKIQNLIEDNTFLTDEIHRLKKLLPKKGRTLSSNQIVFNSLKKLEEQVVFEKNHNRQTIFKLRTENRHLKQQVWPNKNCKEFTGENEGTTLTVSVEELKKSVKSLKIRLKEASGGNRGCRRVLQNYTRESSLDKKTSLGTQMDPKNSGRPVWNSSSNEVKTLKKSQNRFLTSSSSESEKLNLRRARSRNKKTLSKQNLGIKRAGSYRKSSNERSRHSSEDGKGSAGAQKLKLSRGSKPSLNTEGKGKNISSKNLEQAQPKLSSRESSLSSQSSSKQSKVSPFSNRGSGDCRVLTRKRSPRDFLIENEDIKFTMSDLETRIHALQRLLSDGLNF